VLGIPTEGLCVQTVIDTAAAASEASLEPTVVVNAANVVDTAAAASEASLEPTVVVNAANVVDTAAAAPEPLPRQEVVSVPVAVEAAAKLPDAGAAVMPPYATAVGPWASPYENSPPPTAVRADPILSSTEAASDPILSSTEAAFFALDAAAGVVCDLRTPAPVMLPAAAVLSYYVEPQNTPMQAVDTPI